MPSKEIPARAWREREIQRFLARTAAESHMSRRVGRALWTFRWTWCLYCPVAFVGARFLREDWDFWQVDPLLFPIAFLLGLACVTWTLPGMASRVLWRVGFESDEERALPAARQTARALLLWHVQRVLVGGCWLALVAAAGVFAYDTFHYLESNFGSGRYPPWRSSDWAMSSLLLVLVGFSPTMVRAHARLVLSSVDVPSGSPRQSRLGGLTPIFLLLPLAGCVALLPTGLFFLSFHRGGFNMSLGPGFLGTALICTVQWVVCALTASLLVVVSWLASEAWLGLRGDAPEAAAPLP